MEVNETAFSKILKKVCTPFHTRHTKLTSTVGQNVEGLLFAGVC